MSGKSDADHAKSSMCRAMTSTIWSCASWPKDLPSLNFLPPISLSCTSFAGSGRLSQAISTRVTILDGIPISSSWIFVEDGAEA